MYWVKNKKNGTSKYLAEIGWREFNHTLINHFPHMIKNNYSKKFDKFPWEKNVKFLSAWKKGLTGLSDCRCRHERTLFNWMDA